MLRRGPGAPYWGPAHRRAVDIALETRDHAGVLARLEAIKPSDPIPPSAAGERAYLRGRAAYDDGKLADAEGELVTISKKSRLYSSALYLRGVIRARRGEYKDAAEAMCEIAATPDDDKFTFVVDDRYFTVKDLARLGLGRLAHEHGEYDDAYYHYFQIPDDSTYLPDALFEAAWSMYQKRELPTSRDLVKEFLKEFPTSPLWPEASLLAGYVELADCKFDESQKWYDDARREAAADRRRDGSGSARIRTSARAAVRRTRSRGYREVKQTGELEGKKAGTAKATTPIDEVLALLRLDPKFVRLNDAVHRRARAREQRAARRARSGRTSARRSRETKVARCRASKHARAGAARRRERGRRGSAPARARRSTSSARELARAHAREASCPPTPPPRSASASTSSRQSRGRARRRARGRRQGRRGGRRRRRAAASGR